jgi:hypothetical protein
MTVGGTEQQALRAVRYTIIVFVTVVLAVSVFAWRGSRPPTPGVGQIGPMVTPYVAKVPDAYDYYNTCIKVGYAPYLCRNTYLP